MKKNYSELLKDPRWQKKRLQIFKRDKWTCKYCGDKENTLHAHHKKYKFGKEPWNYPLTNFITLCERCHKEIENIKKAGYPIDEGISVNKFPCKNVNGKYMIAFITPRCVRLSFYDQNEQLLFGTFLGRHIISFISKTLNISSHG